MMKHETMSLEDAQLVLENLGVTLEPAWSARFGPYTAYGDTPIHACEQLIEIMSHVVPGTEAVSDET